MVKEYLDSQVAGRNRPLYHKVDHHWFKVAHNDEPLALQVVVWGTTVYKGFVGFAGRPDTPNLTSCELQPRTPGCLVLKLETLDGSSKKCGSCLRLLVLGILFFREPMLGAADSWKLPDNLKPYTLKHEIPGLKV